MYYTIPIAISLCTPFGQKLDNQFCRHLIPLKKAGVDKNKRNLNSIEGLGQLCSVVV